MYLLIIHYRGKYPTLGMFPKKKLNGAIDHAYKNASRNKRFITGFSFHLLNDIL